ncbi:MAG: hypothetical protein QOH57_5268, partial [Mycobacterium sp.]|nr:hypothetical protein [Mycobacterium sp.]
MSRTLRLLLAGALTAALISGCTGSNDAGGGKILV